MAAREADQRLEDLKKNGIKIYSISRLNTYHTCPYQAYLHYVEEIEGKNIGVYGVLGGSVHDQIEACIKDGADKSTIKDAIQDELDNLELLGVEFPKDRNGEDKIKRNWVANMERFAEEFTTPKGKFKTEELLLLRIDDKHYMQGYADAIRYNKDGSVTLIDWKTSTNYTKDKVIEAGRQLAFYKKALEEQGLKVKRTAWCMLKYCITTWEQKGKAKEKISEWRNLVKDLQKPIESALADKGYDDVDIGLIMNEALKNNEIPSEIRDTFHTSIYVRNYDVTEEVMAETMDYIKSTIDAYETMGEDENNYPPLNIEKESFYCNALCEFGGKSEQCKYYVDYCNQFNEEDEDDIF